MSKKATFYQQKNNKPKLKYLQTLHAEILDRKGKSLTWVELSNRTGYSDRHVKRIFEGESFIKNEVFLKITTLGFKKGKKEAEQALQKCEWESREVYLKTKIDYDLMMAMAKLTKKVTIGIAPQYISLVTGSLQIEKARIYAFSFHLRAGRSFQETIRTSFYQENINNQEKVTTTSYKEFLNTFNLTEQQFILYLIRILEAESENRSRDRRIRETIRSRIPIPYDEFKKGFTPKEAEKTIHNYFVKNEIETKQLAEYAKLLKKKYL